MTRDISELLADAAEERTRALADVRLSPARLARTRARVRRRRIMRHSLQTGTSVAAAGAVAVGAWFGLHADRAPELPATTPSSSPVPSSTPSGETTETTPVVTATPVVQPGLPSALPAPDDLLGRTGPGWVLAIYRSVPASDPTHAPATVNAILAVAPDGTRYRLADLPADEELRVLDWRAGDSRARALLGAWSTGIDGGAAGWLDLRTGVFVADAPTGVLSTSGATSYLARLDDGTELWELNDMSGGRVQLYAIPPSGAARWVGDLSDGWTLTLANPSGTRVVSEVVSADRLIVLGITDGARTEIGLGITDGECYVLGWLDDEAVLVQCFDHVADVPVVGWNPRLVRVDVDSGAVTVLTTLAAGQPFVPPSLHGLNVGPGTVAFPAYTLDDELPVASACTNSVWEWSAEGLRRLWSTDGPGSDSPVLDAVGGDVFFDMQPGCRSGLGADEVMAVGPSGASRVVVPALPDATEWATDLSWTPAR